MQCVRPAISFCDMSKQEHSHSHENAQWVRLSKLLSRLGVNIQRYENGF